MKEVEKRWKDRRGFTYKRHLGSGAYADVFEFERNGQTYAVKTYSFESEPGGDGVLNEAKRQQKAAEHGLAPTVYEVGINYLVMDVAGEPLGDYLIDVNRQRRIGAIIKYVALCEKLEEVDAGNNDLHPYNILVKDHELVAIDFARHRKELLYRTLAVVEGLCEDCLLLDENDELLFEFPDEDVESYEDLYRHLERIKQRVIDHESCNHE